MGVGSWVREVWMVAVSYVPLYLAGQDSVNKGFRGLTAARTGGGSVSVP